MYKYVIILFFLFFSNSVFSQLEYEIKDGYVKIYNYLDEFDLLDTVGTDGVRILYHDFWELKIGNDGRIITFPSHWKTEEGKDGRMVAFPNQWKFKEGEDERVVPIPHYKILSKKGQWVKKKKTPNCFSANPDDCYIACYENAVTGFNWDWSAGLDDRLIAITTDLKMQIEIGGDGRKTIVPEDWETHDTSNGKTIAAPRDWDLYEYEDKTFAMIPPFKTVETMNEIIEEENDLILVFKEPYKTTLLQKIKTSNDEEALDVALYWFFNEN